MKSVPSRNPSPVPMSTSKPTCPATTAADSNKRSHNRTERVGCVSGPHPQALVPFTPATNNDAPENAAKRHCVFGSLGGVAGVFLLRLFAIAVILLVTGMLLVRASWAVGSRLSQNVINLYLDQQLIPKQVLSARNLHQMYVSKVFLLHQRAYIHGERLPQRAGGAAPRIEQLPC